MRRSNSIAFPELFLFHDHFEFLELVGRTRRSEASGWRACGPQRGAARPVAERGRAAARRVTPSPCPSPAHRYSACSTATRARSLRSSALGAASAPSCSARGAPLCRAPLAQAHRSAAPATSVASPSPASPDPTRRHCPQVPARDPRRGGAAVAPAHRGAVPRVAGGRPLLHPDGLLPGRQPAPGAATGARRRRGAARRGALAHRGRRRLRAALPAQPRRPAPRHKTREYLQASHRSSQVATQGSSEGAGSPKQRAS